MYVVSREKILNAGMYTNRFRRPWNVDMLGGKSRDFPLFGHHIFVLYIGMSNVVIFYENTFQCNMTER